MRIGTKKGRASRTATDFLQAPASRIHSADGGTQEADVRILVSQKDMLHETHTTRQGPGVLDNRGAASCRVAEDAFGVIKTITGGSVTNWIDRTRKLLI